MPPLLLSHLRPPPVATSQEAEEFAEQDKAVKARVDAKNQLETYAYNIKSTVEDKAKDKVGGGWGPWLALQLQMCFRRLARGACGARPCFGSV